MDNIIKKIRNIKIFPIIAIIIWTLFTLNSNAFVAYNSDEIWAYDIATDMNFIEIIKLMHYEGHAFLWYLILKPFTHFNSLFPYVIKYINWGFCFGLMCLLWFCAPINKYIKILISISSPFLVVYPTLARCYSLAIFLLFVLTILYKDRLKHPILFSITIFLTANTCINGAIAAFILGCFFILDLFMHNNKEWKNKKFITPTMITIAGFLSLAIQWLPVHCPTYFYSPVFDKLMLFTNFFFINSTYKPLVILSFIVFIPLFFYVGVVFFKNLNGIRWKIFAAFTIFVTIFFYIKIAPGQVYHYYFIYVYIIMLYWLLIDNVPDFKLNKSLFIHCSVLLIAISLIFNAVLRNTTFWFTPLAYLQKIEAQINTFVPKGSTIYLYIDQAQSILPYLKYQYNLKTPLNDPIPSYNAYKNIYQFNLNEVNFITPDKMNIKDDNSYYIAVPNYNFSVCYMCSRISGGFVLCKLPISDDIKNVNYDDYYDVKKLQQITVNQIKNILPKTSTLYMDSNLAKIFSSDLSKLYNIKILDNGVDNGTDDYYVFRLHNKLRAFGIPNNCLNINKNYLLCKYNR